MILALDYGDRYIGLAAGQPPETPVHRRGTIDQKSESAIKQIQEIVLHEGIHTVLVGVPIGLAGEETEQTHKSLVFIEKLRESLSAEVDVEGVDETLTSVEAAQNISREGVGKEHEHAEAARLMLIDYIAQQGRLE